MFMNKSRNMLMSLPALVLLTSAYVAGQRPSFAGTRPIGFPETPNRTTTTPDPLGNRFGEGTTQRLPLEANGDRDLVDRLSKLPLDKQPFWFINWQALEEMRKNPQTYPQRPNVFVDPISQNNNRFSNNPGFIDSNTANLNRPTPTTNQGSFYPSQTAVNTNANIEGGNRNGFVQTATNSNVNTNSNADIGNRNGFDQKTDTSGNKNADSKVNLGDRNGFDQVIVSNANTNANSNVELGNKNRFEQTTTPFVLQNVASTEKPSQYYPLKGTYHQTFNYAQAHAHAHSYFYHTTGNYQENNFHSI